MADTQYRKRFILTSLQSWDEWKLRLKAHLQKKKAYRVVMGTEICPAYDSGDEDYKGNSKAIENWEDLDAVAMAAIVETVDSKNLSLIRSAETSAQAYAILARKHESKSVANVSAKMRQLINLVQTTDLPTFTQEIEVLREQIAAGIAAIKDASLLDILAITVMLRGAHPDFGAAIAAINQGDTMDYDSCRADMDAEAERLRYITRPSTRPPTSRGFGKPGALMEDKTPDPFSEKGEK